MHARERPFRREIELDFIRGIAILLVVDFHSRYGLLNYVLGPLGIPPLGWAGEAGGVSNASAARALVSAANGFGRGNTSRGGAAGSTGGYWSGDRVRGAGGVRALVRLG